MRPIIRPVAFSSTAQWPYPAHLPVAHEKGDAPPRLGAREQLARRQIPHHQRIGAHFGIVVEIALAPHAQLQALGLELVVISQELPDRIDQMAAEYLVLIGIEMDAVDFADADDAPASKNSQLISAAIAAIRRADTGGFLACVGELLRHRSGRRPGWRRRDDENWRHRHVRLYWSPAYRAHQRRDALRRVRGIVLMHRLKIVRAQHEDDERERRIDFDALLDSGKAISSRLERIVPDGSAAVQAVLDHAHRKAAADELGLENSRPSLRKRKPSAGAWNDAPAQASRRTRGSASSRALRSENPSEDAAQNLSAELTPHRPRRLLRHRLDHALPPLRPPQKLVDLATAHSAPVALL